MEPKKPVQALQDPSWVEAMQDELLQFKLLKVWTLVHLPKDKRAIDWLFDIDSLSISMNNVPVVAGNQTNGIAGSKENLVAGSKDSVIDAEKKAPGVDESEASKNGGKKDQVTRSEVERLLQQERQTKNINSTNSFNTVSSPVNTVGSSFVNVASQTRINVAGPSASTNAFKEPYFE
nr:putative ribonuclease H-like domain-containing protein [Tanacetum cinerariifolium]